MPLPWVSHTGQGWASPSSHDRCLVSPGPGTWGGGWLRKAMARICAEWGLEALATAFGKWARGSAEWGGLAAGIEPAD